MQILSTSPTRSHRFLHKATAHIPERTPAATADAPPSVLTDEQLMEMIQSQKQGGLDQLHIRYANSLKGLIMKMVHSDADAEDLLQEVFLEIWIRAANYNPLMGRPLSWIATLARRRSIDRLRRIQRYRRLQESFAAQTDHRGGGWTHVLEDLAQLDMNVTVQRAMVALPEAQRIAIKLAYHEQLSQRDIAARTGIPLGTIKTRLALGLKKMAVFLSGFEDLLSEPGPLGTGTKNLASD